MIRKIKKNRLILLLIQLLFWLIGVYLIIDKHYYTGQVILLARYLIVYLLFLAFCLVYLQKKIFTGVNIITCSFVLFQSGLLLIYGIDSNFHNIYIDLFNNKTIVDGIKFTVLSIETYGFVLVLLLNNVDGLNARKNIWFSKFKAINDEAHVCRLGELIFFVTSSFVLPLYSFVAYLSLKNGFSQATRSIVAANPIFNLVRALFIPSFFLVLIFGEGKKTRLVAEVIVLIVCIEALISGNRTDGILWIVTFVYYKSQESNKSVIKNIKLLMAILGVLAIAVLIAQKRAGHENFSIVKSFFEEVGFNFTSVCFVSLYYPESNAFQFGGTYLKSIICMFPSSLDFLGVISPLKMTLPARWLWNANHERFGNYLDFGVGYSAIAESYVNFGYLGFVISAAFAAFIVWILNNNWLTSTKWERYVQTVVFLALLTFPRRDFYELLSNLEYSVLIIGVLIILTKIKRKAKI